ncbi:uncharacterized protein LOC116350256 [Contarinia nasturtii]|uniref:uncharacterized protein LOC116350256 n=1 Tax=Contarinia nasturtii TaxID=265458 RepID=UPI0012D43E43|nr:uncharacterized protein LOC116350256 [Contarinia nasturtii]
MFENIFRQVGSIIHSTFIPVVYAQQSEPKSVDDENVWDRLKVITEANKYGALSHEVTSVINYIQNGVLFGSFVGISIFTKNQYVDFVHNERASQYKWHLDAKRELTNRWCKGAVSGAATWGIKCTIVAATFGILVNLIPIIRNENSWPEFIVSGLVTGTLAGQLFSNPDELGFQSKKYNGRFSYRTSCLMKGAGYGLLAGVYSGLYSLQKSNRLNAAELKKWEKYWKKRLQRGETGTKTD